jgi:hypothetical protein
MTQKISTLSLPLINSTETLVFTGLSFLSFIVPFSLGHPQWLVGTIINASLFLAAIFLPKKFFIPLIILPSLGVLGRGIIFGPFTLFLIYFLPFIWFGNLILILVFKMLYKKFDSRRTFVLLHPSLRSGNKLYYLKFFLSVFCAAAVKFLFLMAIANLYFKFHLVPAVFLQAMGISQLLTALAGGIIAWIMFNIYGEYHARNQRTA